MAESTQKVRENRLRRAAERQGLSLSKSRTRDPRAVRFGEYTLSRGPLAPDRANAVFSSKDVNELERFLTR